MPTVNVVTHIGQRSYTPAAGQFITGGQLVEGTDGSRIKVAAAGSTRVLGVALYDAVAPEDQFPATTPVVQGRPVVFMGALPKIVAVASDGAEVPMVYATAAAFGDRLVAAANGQVAAAGATPDARAIVGRCTAPAGVAAGATGLATIF